MEVIFDFIRDYGVEGFLLVTLVLIIEDPERAVKLKALFIKPLFNFFKLGSKQYIASEVGYTATQYIRRHVTKYVPSVNDPKIRIKWVTSPADPVFQSDGTLIIRMQETNDQTRNILTATRVALPRIVCPSLRPNLEKYTESAIDLTILKNLSDKLGKHAQPVFQQYFLAPEIEENKRISELFSKLIILDESGIFVSILLEELNLLGEYLFSTGDTSDKTGDILSLIEYLLGIATRQVREHIELEYISPCFKIGVMLLAISARAENEGLPPYLRRIKKNLNLGCESLYIASYPRARSFLRRLVKALDTNERIEQVKWNILLPVTSIFDGRKSFSEIVMYRRNDIFDDTTFTEKINELGLSDESIITGHLFDITQFAAMVDLGGVFGVVSLDECSWYTQINCRDIFVEGSERLFTVMKINLDKEIIELSRKIPDENPWRCCPIPAVGDVVQSEIRFQQGDNYICRSTSGLELTLPRIEVSWGISIEDEEQNILGSSQQLIVTDVDEENQKIISSIRQITKDPWPIILEELPPGMAIQGKVSNITQDIISIELPNGILGYIPRQYIQDAGLDFDNFTQEIQIGQYLDVIVSKVFDGKGKIRLNIAK